LLPDPGRALPSVPALITGGLVPFLLVAGTIYLFMNYLKRKFTLNRSEYIQSLIIMLVVSYAVLSLTGIFFRGAGMKLMWPWEI